MSSDDISILTVFLFIACIIIFTFFNSRRHNPLHLSRRGAAYHIPLPSVQNRGPDLFDVGQQLHAVMKASFQRRRLLNASEYQAFKIIEEDITTARCGYRVFAQTSLGEVLTSPSENAFRSINSKRVDMLIVDRGGWPVMAVEYQGRGHFQGTAAARDGIKKEALRKAGVRYVEITEGDDAAQIRARVRQHLGWKSAAPTTL